MLSRSMLVVVKLSTAIGSNDRARFTRRSFRSSYVKTHHGLAARPQARILFSLCFLTFLVTLGSKLDWLWDGGL